MKKKITVTIGIPVYNEEANVANLLTSVLEQKEIDYTLEKIIIVCDASTDKTYKIVQSFKDPRKLHLRNPERQGQQFSQNVILKNSQSDVTVILEGDIIPESDFTINELIKPFLVKNNKVAMAIGVPKAVKAKGFYERVLNNGHRFRTNLFGEWKEGINVYTAGGHSMKAINRRFSKNFRWPSQVPEDAYIYLKLISEGFTMVRNPKAVALMRNPTTFKDRLKQVAKFQSGRKTLEKYFPSIIVKSEYNIPFWFGVSCFLKEFFKNPFYLSLYLMDMSLNRILTKGKKQFNALYEPYSSSKKIK